MHLSYTFLLGSSMSVEKVVEVEKIVECIVEVEVQWGWDQGDVGMQTDPSFLPICERRTTLVLGRSPTITPRKSGTFLADAGGNEAEAENETEMDMEGYEDARASLRLGSRDDLGSVHTADFRSVLEGGFASSWDNFAWSQEDFQSMHAPMDAEGGSDTEEDGEASVKALGMRWLSSFYVLTPAQAYVEQGRSDTEEDGEVSVKALGMQRPSSFYVPTPAQMYVEQGVDPAAPVVESALPLLLPVVAPELEPLPPKPGVKEMSAQTDEWTPPPAPVTAIVPPSTPVKTVQAAAQMAPGSVPVSPAMLYRVGAMGRLWCCP
ncbi:hypothetical protein B0H14DRAFT_3507946 [Mycena olivaceomarginata]|nr:hypothetical protein B0H14DRAFT_3507946 [Mycena olivaceomarginata]